MDEKTVIEKDQYLQDFINRPITKITKYRIINAFRLYLRFYSEELGMKVTPTSLLERAEKERSKGFLESGKPEREWVSYVGWLQTSCSKTDTHGNELGKPLGYATIRSYAGIVKSFYAHYGIPMSKRAAFPKQIAMSRGKLENVSIPYRPEMVRKLVGVMDNNEHKAIALLQFQSGVDVSTALSLRYRDVRRGLEAGETPMLLTLKRSKTGMLYKTCIGRDAFEAIRTHVTSMELVKFRCTMCGSTWKVRRKKCPYCKRRTVKELRDQWKSDDFIFGRSREDRSRVSGAYQLAMRGYVVLAGIQTPEELEDSDINRGRPHALRAAFSSILKGQGAPDQMVEFWMGHEVPYGSAYFKQSDQEIIDTYKQYEKYLAMDFREDYDVLEARVNAKVKDQEVIILGLKEQVRQLEEEQKLAGKLLALLAKKPEIIDMLKDE